MSARPTPAAEPASVLVEPQTQLLLNSDARSSNFQLMFSSGNVNGTIFSLPRRPSSSRAKFLSTSTTSRSATPRRWRVMTTHKPVDTEVDTELAIYALHGILTALDWIDDGFRANQDGPDPLDPRASCSASRLPSGCDKPRGAANIGPAGPS